MIIYDNHHLPDLVTILLLLFLIFIFGEDAYYKIELFFVTKLEFGILKRDYDFELFLNSSISS